MKKFFRSAVAVFLAVISVYFLNLYVDKLHRREQNSEIKSNESIASENSAEDGKYANLAENTEDAAANSANVTKYILKYYNGKSVLICHDGGMVRSETEVPDINFDYLTETDKKLLREGIMLDSLEAAYKLIEDYSS